MTLYARQQERHRCKEQTWTLREGEGGMIWENDIETGILSYVKQIASPGLMHETRLSQTPSFLRALDSLSAYLRISMFGMRIDGSSSQKLVDQDDRTVESRQEV